MFKKLFQLIFIATFFIADVAYAFTCSPPQPGRIAADFDIIFVAFVTKAYFVEGEDVDDCGWVEGTFELVESLKGNYESVTVVRKRLRNCGNSRIGGASDYFPIGKNILVTTNNEVANIGQCTRSWSDDEPHCLIDDIRRHLNIEAVNAEAREWCSKVENPRGRRSPIQILRMDLAELESESESINREIIEVKDKLSEAELSESLK